MAVTKKSVVPVFLVLLATVACIHKVSGPVSPMEKVMTYNAMFAETNQTIEQGTEVLVSSGSLTTKQATPVIRFCGQAAGTHKQITLLLQKGGTVSLEDFTTIHLLLNQIADSGRALATSGDLGVKNPKTQQTIAQDVESMVALGNVLLNSIQAVTKQ